MNKPFRSEDIPEMGDADLLDSLMASPDLQHSRVTVVTKEWQKAHGKPNTLPDLGMLIDWMWGQVKVCEFLIDSRKKPEVVLADKYCPLCGNQLRLPK